jgi:hypothetical protein
VSARRGTAVAGQRYRKPLRCNTSCRRTAGGAASAGVTTVVDESVLET